MLDTVYKVSSYDQENFVFMDSKDSEIGSSITHIMKIFKIVVLQNITWDKKIIKWNIVGLIAFSLLLIHVVQTTDCTLG